MSELAFLRAGWQAGLWQFGIGVNAVGGGGKSLLHHTPLLRALRIALGAALFVVFFTVLSSSGAFAASDSHQSGQTSSSQAPAKGKGLLSGILSPINDAVDTTVSQVPVVRDITGNNTVAKVVAPVATVADRVETGVNSVPVVGEVVAPVRNATNSVVPPVVNVVGAVSTPVLKTVDQVTAPAVQIVAPVLAPVTSAVKPVVDGVTDGASGGVSNVVDQVLPPVEPGTPGTPGNPGTDVTKSPATGVGPGTNAPGLPGSIDGATSGHNSADEPSGPNASPSENHGKPAAGVHSAPGSAHVGTLAEYLAIAPRASMAGDGPSSNAGAPLPPGGAGYAACGTDSSGSAVGPCAPAVSSSPASGSSSGTGSGGSGGSVGSAAAHENFAGHFSIALSGSALRSGNWPLPSSLSSDPGSTPD